MQASRDFGGLHMHPHSSPLRFWGVSAAQGWARDYFRCQVRLFPKRKSSRLSARLAHGRVSFVTGILTYLPPTPLSVSTAQTNVLGVVLVAGGET